MAWHSPDTTARIGHHDPHTDSMAVDFSNETIIFTRMNILTQSGAFALSQTNVVTVRVLALLQGGANHN